MIDRRNLLAGIATTFALAACGRGGGGEGVLRVGSQKGGTKSLMLASGALDGAPYKIEWSEFPAAQNLLEAIGSGAVDTGLVGDAPFQFAYQAGSPIKAIGAQTTQQRVPGAIALVVPAASPIRDAKGLKGKRIAATRGSVGHYLLLRAMLSAGLSAKDVKTVFLAPSDSRAAMQTGAVDGWSTWQPYVATSLAEGDRIAIDGRGLTQGYGFDIAHESAIRDKRALLADFLQREAKALQWASAHVDDFARVLSQETGLPPAIAKEMASTGSRLRVPIDRNVIERQQVVFDTFRQFGEVKADRPVKDAFVLKL
ncbi:aliphatic sulfonate ABC transporter substrate-binding protein [Novosphingobium barchaimii LL02]|uniref:Putative aliphatic sulfonates-binding protein n=1 Tax=Novosphingobium barchaimii LL02 TaxID=1114963 RepID=A0A0J7XTQ8_9SPHN|nr:ABC transporter substrate-binding protein [Novosphingobium barchaimii]KMS55022.1 aliphatic sulfonate ABC transporter substrate-binding protein [Novosphingobium barchaimii LL02]